MGPISLTDFDGERVLVEADAIAGLQSAVGHRLILPEHPGFEAARRVWNGMIDRVPAIIVRCRGVSDVLAGLRFAREHGVLVAVRGGGHNVAGYGTCDGGLVIDLSAMRHVRHAPETCTARAAGGATWADVDRETQAFARAVPGGIVSTTGVAGLTLGGGQGWLRRTHGMASDALLSADVVTADGDVVRASEAEHPDLFWALRGGGGNFGVVTSFEFRTHAVGPMLAFAGPVYPLESSQTVAAAVRDFVEDATDEVNVSLTWWSIPSVDTFPSELHGRPVVIVGAVYVGDPALGGQVLAPLRSIEQPLLDLSSTLPYSALQTLFDPFFPPHELQYYWKSMYLAVLEADAVQVIAEHAASRPSPRSMVGVWALGGALDRASEHSTAAGTGGAPYLLEILANWRDPTESARNIQWAREVFAAMQTFGTGTTNVNFPGLGNDLDYTRAAFPDVWDRLVEVKRRYDPDNVFRLNQNIVP